MRRGLLLALAVGAAALAPAAAAEAAPARKAAPAARDWSRTVAATPEGGFRMGNPAARVRLVEYGSLTCPHCAAFAREGAPPLVQRYVRTGRVSYEYRNFVLNGIDIAATLLARCSGARGFFAMVRNLYATQPQWVGRITAVPDAQMDQLKSLPEGQRLVRLAGMGGLTQVAARFGVAPAQARQCLAAPGAVDRLGKIYEGGEALGVHGTPTFFVNGAMLEGNTWSVVEPALRRAGG